MIYKYKVKDVDGNLIALEKYRGNVILVVNTATKCGFTNQYEGLQKLYDKYQHKGFVILDFPCNQFLFQAPGSVEEIKEFCELNYQTTFPLFQKIKVNGFFAHQLYKYLKSNSPQEYSPGQTEVLRTKRLKHKKIKWNFTKFLIDQNGNIIYRFSPQVKPEEIDNFIFPLL